MPARHYRILRSRSRLGDPYGPRRLVIPRLRGPARPDDDDGSDHLCQDLLHFLGVERLQGLSVDIAE
jgi:hypothetical protein